MNFLAHIYLSGDNDNILIGNFIADHVKGKSIYTYPDEIKKGILLHRFIDTFTDSHPIVEESKARIRNTYHKYTPVIVDIFYDHLLAANWNNYHTENLEVYSGKVYKLLNDNIYILPERTQTMLKYMVAQNWLLKYATLEGTGRVLSGMSQRAKFPNAMNQSVIDLEKYYSFFKSEFELFFVELKEAVLRFEKTI
jgi:acyl carrier protein phosphodiesterase